MLIFECRFILRQYDQTELKNSFSVCDRDNAVDGVPSVWKLDIADSPSTAAHSAKLNILQKEDDFKNTTPTRSKGGVVIFEAVNFFLQQY